MLAFEESNINLNLEAEHFSLELVNSISFLIFELYFHRPDNPTRK